MEDTTLFSTGLEEDRLLEGHYDNEREALSYAYNWYCLCVKSRHEFVAAAELKRKGIEAFLPSAKRLSQWRDRKKIIEFPLFPGYVFVSIPSSPGAFLSSLKTRGVVTFISLEKGNPTPVSQGEIYSLKAVIESGREFEVYSHFREGTKVRVRKGPLSGAEGIIQKKKDNYSFVINIDILGRSVSVNISADDIEAD